jgi:hypothetical protein
MFFKKSNRKGKTKISSIAIRAALGLHKRVLSTANSLNKKINALSIQKIKTGLVIFCLLFGATSMYTVYRGFQKKKENRIAIQPIRLPKSIKSGMMENQEIIRHSYQKIKSFQNYMQELKKNNPSKADSLLRLRPGLMDSVKIILKLYETQLNN